MVLVGGDKPQTVSSGHHAQCPTWVSTHNYTLRPAWILGGVSWSGAVPQRALVPAHGVWVQRTFALAGRCVDKEQDQFLPGNCPRLAFLSTHTTRALRLGWADPSIPDSFTQEQVTNSHTYTHCWVDPYLTDSHNRSCVSHTHLATQPCLGSHISDPLQMNQAMGSTLGGPPA